MPNKKINQLTPRTPTLTDLILVGDPTTGYSYKATLSVMAAFVGSNIQFSSLGGVSLTSPTNGQYLTFNGVNWVNSTLTTTTWDTAYNRSLTAAAVTGTTTKTLTLTKQDGSTLTASWTDINTVTSVFGRTGVVVAAEGDYSLDQLGDVVISTPTNGQVLSYNGTAWVNSSSAGGGISSLNGLTATTQTFATGTSGTDFAIVSTTSTHTFNLPTASATNRGALSSTDWTIFNSKQDTITLTTTGSSGAATFLSNTLNIPTYTLSGLGGVSGSGTTNYLPKWTGSSALGNSLIQDDGTNVGIGITPATYKFRVSGNAFSSSYFVGTTSNTLDQFKSGGLISFASSGTSSYTQIGYDASLNAGWISAVTEGSAYRPIILGYSSNVGISTTAAPVSRLEIQAAQFPAITLRKTGIGTWTIGNRTESTGTNFNISYGTSDILNVTTNGRVLIGTTTESTYELDVVGDIRSSLDANINGLTVGKGGGNVATNTAVGVQVINSGSATGSANTGVGYVAFQVLSSGSNNTAIGNSALKLNSTANFNTAVGSNAAQATSTAGFNTAIGASALFLNSTGAYNTMIGMQSGYDITGNYNTGLGLLAARGITSGTYNTMIGANDASYAGNGITTGSYNVVIGSNVSGLSSSLSNTIILADGQGNQRLYINNNGDALINTTTASYSSAGRGNITIGGTAGSILGFQTSGVSKGYLYHTGNDLLLLNEVAGSLSLGTNAGTRATIFSTGNFAIGTTTDAGQKLQISGNIQVDNAAGQTSRINTSTTGKFIVGKSAGNDHFVYDGSTNYVTILNLSTNMVAFRDNIVDHNGASYYQFRNGAYIFANGQRMRIDFNDQVSTNRVGLQLNYGSGAHSSYKSFQINDNSIEKVNIDVNYNFSTLGGGTFGTLTPETSAILSASSTTKGFLPPRMTSSQRTAISTPAVGLLVYQTDATEGTYEYTSGGWRIINAAAGGGSGTVTSVSVVSANGFAGSVATATTTPAITLSTTITGILKGNGTAISAATAGTDYLTPSDVAYSIASISTTHSETATKGTKILKADTTGGTFTITLPTAVGNTATIIIKKVAGTATLTIDGAGTETIDGGLTASIVEVYESVTLISDNSNWQII